MGLRPFHRLYKLRDGWVYVVARTKAEQMALCQLSGFPASAAKSEPGRHPNEGGMATAMADAFRGRTLTDMLAALATAGVPASEAQAGDSELFLGDPHAIANDMVITRAHPTAGELTVAWNYIQFGRTAPSAGRPTPLLGEQTDEMLKDIGYDPGAIRSLHETRVVKVERAPAPKA